MRWRRISATSGLLGFVIGVAIAAPVVSNYFKALRMEAAQSPRPHLATREDWGEILIVLLESHNFDGLPLPPPEPGEPPRIDAQRVVVLQTTSEIICQGADDPCSSHPIAADFTSTDAGGIPAKLRRELVAANTFAVSVPIPRSTLFVAASSVEIETIFAGNGWWDDFYTRFPNTAGIMKTSQPVVTEDGRYALIYAESSCDGKCGNGGMYFLERTQVGWNLVRVSGMWMA